MDDASIAVGQMVIGIAATAALVALALRSPLFRWCAVVGLMLVWLAFAVLLPAGMGLAQAARGDYALAAMSLTAAAVLGVFWRVIGWSVLLRSWRLRSVYWHLWR